MTRKYIKISKYRKLKTLLKTVENHVDLKDKNTFLEVAVKGSTYQFEQNKSIILL